MGISRRLMLAVASTLAALASVGAVSVTAAPAAADEGVRTTLVGGHPNPLGIHLVLTPRARLTVTETGAPLAGQRVDFWLTTWSPIPVCSGVTDADGVAQCGSPVVLRDILLTGAAYEARFYGATVGDQWHWGSQDLVQLLTGQ